MNVKLRRWKIEDAEFCISVRNHPDLKRWFRQDRDLTLAEQKVFIFEDLQTYHYNGQVILADGVPVGLCAVNKENEFSIGVLPEYQHQGIATKAMNLLLEGKTGVWSEVFVDNPALCWYIKQLDFTIAGVKEKAYYKNDVGYVDVVKIRHE